MGKEKMIASSWDEKEWSPTEKFINETDTGTRHDDMASEDG
jgi:hypothetical protein